jgi:transcriptional regulator with XRE-family HTH domain
MDLKRIIANNIFILRQQYKLTQEEFAEKLKVTRANISHIENAVSMPSAEFIHDVSLAFGVSTDWILNSNINTKDIIFNDKDIMALIRFHNLDSHVQDAVLNFITELLEISSKK